jgi:tetrahydromethanopterin S-methyltransferase subunit G
MTHLPRYDPVDVAIKTDLLGFESSLTRQFDQRFEHIDQRFEHIDQRFEHIDQRFEHIDQRFERVDKRFDLIDGRLDALVGRLDRLFLAQVAGLFVIVAAMAGVVFATL